MTTAPTTTIVSSLSRLGLAAGLALSLTSCWAEPELDSSLGAAGSECKPWGCGDNSPVLDNRGFHELHRDGHAHPNPDGLYINKFYKGGTSYRIDIDGPRLVGRNGGGAIALQNGALTGAIIEVRSVADPGFWYDLEIKEVSAAGAAYWQGPATAVETYRIEYGGHGQGRETPLCDNPTVTTHGQQEGAPMNVYDVAVFGSERYDAAGKTIVATGAAADGWINFGCSGGVLAKLLLDRHVPVAHTVGFVTTLPARQAMLKMFAADYCGTGASFTHTGEPLAWRDAAGWVPDFPLVTDSMEAWWTEDGAVCLEVPRLTTTDQPYPGVLEDDIKRACGQALPLCSSLPDWPDKFGSARFISANPSGS